MRGRMLCLAALLTIAAPPGLLAGDLAARDRAAVIAALERVILTGEPRHNDHDEGEWLQRSVDAAFARGDLEVVHLAQRAAVALVARVTPPISRIGEPPSISLEQHAVLKLPRPKHSITRIVVSVDGGEPFEGDALLSSGGTLTRLLPQAPHTPGLHHLRVQAHIAYEGDDARVPPPEIRNLPEVVYAVYDPDRAGYDSRTLVLSPAVVKAAAFNDAADETWPSADLSVSPEDIIVRPTAAGLRVQATIHNVGTADAAGALIGVSAGTASGDRGGSQSFVRDIPPGGTATIEAVLPFGSSYGIVFVQTSQLSEHAPAGQGMPDPSPEDALAFRIVNPRQAPRGYLQDVRSLCGYICRGY